MKVVSIVGARPQFIKAAAISRVLRRQHSEFMVHTGQHYDANMSAIFFDEMGIPQPDVNLDIGSGPHGKQTGMMMAGIEAILLEQHPDWTLIYGDTNSTLAGALASAKLRIPVVHVEAGLRSFNRSMPEEINRVLSDHTSDLLLCPSQTAVNNLMAEGIIQGVHLVGDVMADGLFHAVERATSQSKILAKMGLEPGKFLLATVHRAENTDNESRMRAILDAFESLTEVIILPAHPRTRHALNQVHYKPPEHVRVIDPVGYLDMVMLEQSARMILTDSGGVQKEAYWLGIPCVTLRDETEWIETVELNWNSVVGADKDRIIAAARSFQRPSHHPPLYGDGRAAEHCVELMESTQTPEC